VSAAFPRVLILGGTAEARALARLCAAAGIDGLVSLAGVAPAAEYALPMRSGGFGGPAGLARFMAAEGIGALIDATHRFAARMPVNAVAASRRAGVPLLQLKRPVWPPGPGWHDVADLPAAATALPQGGTALLATGRSSWPAFATRADCLLWLRCLVPPQGVPPHIRPLVAPPGDLAAETALLSRLGVTHLVAKNSGGPAAAKLEAAAALGLAVVMVAPPRLPDAPRVATPAAALDWLAGDLPPKR